MLLRDAATMAGAHLFQPAELVALDRRPGSFTCKLDNGTRIEARKVIAACGSWNARGVFAVRGRDPRASDLLAFKAHFRATQLPHGLMPLLAFPGGYGGMVHTDDGRTSLSCCIRRDALAAVRHGGKAGEAVLAHITATTRGVAEALHVASLDGAILSAGPIQPGIRPRHDEGVFFTGNSAGEAHPIIAEGISMALQSAWLACQAVRPLRGRTRDGAGLAAAAVQYQGLWNNAFATRIRASALFAQLAVRPGAARALLPLLRACPALLTMAARWSGKSRQIVPRAAARRRAA